VFLFRFAHEHIIQDIMPGRRTRSDPAKALHQLADTCVIGTSPDTKPKSGGDELQAVFKKIRCLCDPGGQLIGAGRAVGRLAGLLRPLTARKPKSNAATNEHSFCHRNSSKWVSPWYKKEQSPCRIGKGSLNTVSY
jgi:hypothetical protein